MTSRAAHNLIEDTRELLRDLREQARRILHCPIMSDDAVAARHLTAAVRRIEMIERLLEQLDTEVCLRPGLLLCG